MKRIQSFKFVLMPNERQAQAMTCYAGACRFLYNKALALQKANHDEGGKYISYVSMANQLPRWKKAAGFEWLKEPPAQALQHALKDCDRAYQNFFKKRTSYPRYKRRGERDSFRYPDAKQFKIEENNRRIFLPKLGWIRYRQSRTIEGSAKNATVSYVGGRWMISIQTEQLVATPKASSTSIVGIDVGIAHFASMSDGAQIAAVNALKARQKRLAWYQKQMSRKKKFSQNWKKAKYKVQKCHILIANTRRDFLHKLSHTISKNHAFVCIEDLQIRNMSKSSKGTRDQPGKQVLQKSGLNKAILDQGWGEFRRQLEYKMQWNGGLLLAVPPHNTSRTCPACLHVAKENRQTQALFSCVACAYTNHADIVGAINILERGSRLLACGEQMRLDLSMKQEPVEVCQAIA